MSKLTKKFMTGLGLIMVIVMFLSLYVNQNFIERLFLYQEKQELNFVCDQVAAGAGRLDDIIKEAEESEDVVIAWVSEPGNNEQLNEQLRTEFLKKGISLKKYWLWDQDQQDTMETGRKTRVYRQEKLNYSLLVEYLSLDEGFVAVAKIVPNVKRTLALASKAAVAIFAVAGLIMFILISFLVRRITSPLKEIGETARAIANLDFKTSDVHTKDELEDLSKDINDMSVRLKQAHQELEQKNRQMKELLSNVSHDLKTPVALIKAYSSGIKDGIDDGTFLDTIILQNGQMERIIERLLDLARIQQRECRTEPMDLSAFLRELIGAYQIQEQTEQVRFQCVIEDGVTAASSREAADAIFGNLLSNAVKYAAGGVIQIELSKTPAETRFDTNPEQEEDAVFRITNRVSDESVIETDRLWEPFYVAEESRNAAMSGTGLGLSIVKAAAERYGYECDCVLKEGMITFSVRFHINAV